MVSKVISLFKNDLRRLNKLIGLLIGGLIFNWLVMLISYDEDIPRAIFNLIFILASIFIPLINLSYLFNSTKQNQFYSLPLTRIQGFIVHYLSGFSVLIVLIGIFGLLLQVNVTKLLLIVIIYYSLANLTAYCTTSYAGNTVLFLALVLLPIILYLCLSVVYTTYIRGFELELSNNISLYLMPCIALLIDEVNNSYMFIYVGYCLVIILLAAYMCKIRKLENNYHGYSNKMFANIIVLGIIICLSWAILAITGTQSASFQEFIILNIMITIVMVFIVQFIYHRKIRYVLCILQSIFIIFTTTTLFLTTANYLEYYIPDKVSKASITPSESNGLYITNPQSITKIKEVHENILQSDTGDYPINITYYTSDGNRVVRSYNVSKQVMDEAISNLDDNILDGWLYESNFLLEVLTSNDVLSYNTLENNNIYDKNLFVSILKKQIDNFENNRDLLKNIDYRISTNIYIENGNDTYTFLYYQNDPIDLTFDEYNKINAN